MNLEEYKNNLVLLSKELQSFDPKFADFDPEFLNTKFDIVYNSGVLNISYLEKELQNQFKLELFKTLTKHSGSLAFLVIQTLAANSIMVNNKFPKADEYLKHKCGIAINHLRAPKTIVEAMKTKGGYLLNGTLTWASGYTIFDTLLIGFHYHNDEKEAVAPFRMQEGFNIGNVDETFVGYGLNTVNITLRDYFVKDEYIVSTKPKGNYTKNKSASKTVHYCLYGLGVQASKEIRDIDIKEYLTTNLEALRTQFVNTNDTDLLDQSRVELFNLVQKCVTTGMILNGGKSILLGQKLQRIYRELIMFNSNGLNDKLKSLFKESFLKES